MNLGHSDWSRALEGALVVVTALPLFLGACDVGSSEAEGASESEGTDDDTDSDGPDGGDGWEELPAPELPAEILDYSHDLPAHFLTPVVAGFDNTPAANPTTDAGATLGRVLFWDKRLSQNGAVACGSCHAPDEGFSDQVALSEGFDGDTTRRNSMSLINVRWYARGAMFWDERAETLEDQVLMPIQDSAEMGLTLDELVERVSTTDYYPALFEAAFGDSEINSERISLALSQFVRSIVSYRAQWDEGVELVGGDISQDFPNYSAEENRGKDIFFGQGGGAGGPGAPCGACHMVANPFAPAPPNAPAGGNTAVFMIPAPSNNGLIDDSDGGLGETTGEPQDDGRFKSSSLRNVGLTAPYMHDGRFGTLEEVVTHYNEGLEAHPNIDPILTAPGPGGGQPIQLNLSGPDQQALVAFMRTLSDATLATDPRWADPFPG